MDVPRNGTVSASVNSKKWFVSFADIEKHTAS